ncbi:AGE family epimerase/isomerase [Carboxylicivirga mesophila]|uniref:Cellobiose 2-epimerase n=1 Tax=Carboxylicivirga mesophila TaxID=1166478 RepID=A0ABS5KBP2_9BACT|nr:AGE family epimerase/isomerase [Carboxylicivirga mesophila]MBS2211951.1 AGE family epimerase/isomerase [Carboxylicivirga mesophila]
MKDFSIYIRIKAEMQEELKQMLGFWEANAIDEANGGFIGEMDSEGKVIDNAEKGAVLNARLLWTFSAAYNFTRQAEYLKLAQRAYDYLINKFWDAENGGLFWSLNANGTVHNSRKQAYAQGFGIYGFSEYFKASGHQKSLDYAIRLFELLEAHFHDSKFGGYIEALAINWQPLKDMRLSEKDANEPKSMNTHLHIIEPYTNLYRVWPDVGLKEKIRDLIAVFSDKIVDKASSHFKLFFEMDWTVKSTIVSYGHDIEGAWLLTEAAHIIEDIHLLRQMTALAVKMVDVTMVEGFDTDGSIFYERDAQHLDTDKHWWPQAEGMVGLLDAYQHTHNTKYLSALEKIWRFIQKHQLDRAKGEWYWKVSQEGVPDRSLPKVGFWKCPYHNSRALMEAISRINEITNR